MTDPETSNEKVDLVEVREFSRVLEELSANRSLEYGVRRGLNDSAWNLIRLADELEQSRKEIERLREALSGIAQQKTSDEHNENQAEPEDVLPLVPQVEGVRMSDKIWLIERWNPRLGRWIRWSPWHGHNRTWFLGRVVQCCRADPGRAFRIACYAREE